MKNKIMILTHREGFEADPVIDELRERCADVFRFNTDDGENVSKISFSLRDRTKMVLECDGRVLDGDEVKAAWFQQSYPFDIDSTDPIITLQRANLRASYDQMENFMDCRWLNRPDKVRTASNKILQLKVANEAGMNTPETLVSSDAGAIRDFCREPSVMKNLNTPWFFNQGEFKAAYTRNVTDEVMKNEEALEFAPIIYQRVVDKREECRVVMINGKDYAVSSPPSEESIDIREENKTGDNFRPATFPKDQKEKLLKFMSRFGVESCGADYLIDNNGKWIFLEANISGAWWWVDKHFGGEIKRAIADYLTE